MARYFFNFEGAQTFRDEEGSEISNMQGVRMQAIQNASEVLKDHADAFTKPTHWRVYVADERGREVFVVTVQVETGGPE